MQLSTVLNGRQVSLDIAPDARLIDVLRNELELTGTKEGCAEGECGACTVVIDGVAVNACLVLAAQVQGKSVLTVEGLASAGHANALQRKFVELGAIQCGFCTPGMLMSATALLARNSKPSHDEIRRALAGNLCRCTGYAAIIEAVAAAADEGGSAQ
ncbi:MAG TPA: (2Fe-2S)-binding protein [Steroidobacteraceae bacterium]|nr:(2Fe-2S)-binding protein [Steroidobacteraceae bacterium]